MKKQRKKVKTVDVKSALSFAKTKMKRCTNVM